MNVFFLQISYTEEFDYQRGKGSFPAMITPGYYLAKKAQENASDVSFDRSVVSPDLKFSMIHTWGLSDFCEVKEGRSGGHSRAISWQHRHLFKHQANLPLQLKYKKDLNKMKGMSHFHSLTTEDNLILKNAQKINKIVSEVRSLFSAVS